MQESVMNFNIPKVVPIVHYEPFWQGIILLAIVILISIFKIKKAKKRRKNLSKKFIIFVVILTFLIPVFQKNYYSGGCEGTYIIYYKNIFTITVLQK